MLTRRVVVDQQAGGRVRRLTPAAEVCGRWRSYYLKWPARFMPNLL